MYTNFFIFLLFVHTTKSWGMLSFNTANTPQSLLDSTRKKAVDAASFLENITSYQQRNSSHDDDLFKVPLPKQPTQRRDTSKDLPRQVNYSRILNNEQEVINDFLTKIKRQQSTYVNLNSENNKKRKVTLEDDYPKIQDYLDDYSEEEY